MAYGSEVEKLERRWMDNPMGLTFAPLAEAYRRAGDQARALEVLAVGLANHPSYVPALIVQARCHLDAGEDRAAEDSFQAVLASDPHNLIALKGLAEICERDDRPDQARGYLERLLEADPTHDEGRAQLDRLAVVVVPPPADVAAVSAQPVAPEPELLAVTMEPEPEPEPEETLSASLVEAPDEPARASLNSDQPALDLDDQVLAIEHTSVETDLPAAAPPVSSDETPPEAALDLGIEKEVGPFDSFDPGEWSGASLGGGEAPGVPFEEELPAPSLGLEPNSPWRDELDDLASMPTDEPPPVEELDQEPFAASESALPHWDDDGMPSVAAEMAEASGPDSIGEFIEAGAEEAEEEAKEEENVEVASDGMTAEAIPEPRWSEPAGPGMMEGSAEDRADDTVAGIPPSSADLAPPPFEPLTELEGSAEWAAEPEFDEPAAAWEPEGLPAVAEPPAGPAAAEESVVTDGGEELAEPPLPSPAVPEPAVSETDSPSSDVPSADEPVAAPMEPSEAQVPAGEPDLVMVVPGADTEATDDPEPEIEPDLVITETMARVFERQGHRTMALAVYGQLAHREPDNARLREAVQRLSMELAPDAGRGETSSFEEAAGAVPNDRLVGALLSQVAGAAAPEPESAQADISPLAGEPTRPSTDPLALSAVFGDEVPAQSAPPPVPAETGPSFDEFFAPHREGGRGSGSPATEDEDLEQFSAWLRSLKR